MLKYFIEIKNRFFLLLINCFFTFIITYLYKEILLFTLVQPSSFTKESATTLYFIFTDVTEIFSVYIKLIFFICFQIILIFFTYHTFIFFSFALFKKEYNFLKLFYKISFFIWVLSGVLSNNLIIPLTWVFFLSFQDLISLNHSLKIHFEAKISEYFYFYTYFYYACLFYFQFIVILFLFFKYVNNSLSKIKKFRKLYYFFFVIFSTLLSPDFISQFVLSLFIIIIYEGFVLFFLFNKHIKYVYFIKVTS